MGTAENWQTRLVKNLEDTNLLVLNPRRDDWDSTQEQTVDNPYFNEQVNWELDNLESADFIVFYFDPKTKSPITMMELGLMANSLSNHRMVVCCPKEFWRRGNVEIVCMRHDVLLVENYGELVDQLENWKREYSL